MVGAHRRCTGAAPGGVDHDLRRRAQSLRPAPAEAGALSELAGDLRSAAGALRALPTSRDDGPGAAPLDGPPMDGTDPLDGCLRACSMRQTPRTSWASTRRRSRGARGRRATARIPGRCLRPGLRGRHRRREVEPAQCARGLDRQPRVGPEAHHLRSGRLGPGRRTRGAGPTAGLARRPGHPRARRRCAGTCGHPRPSGHGLGRGRAPQPGRGDPASGRRRRLGGGPGEVPRRGAARRLPARLAAASRSTGRRREQGGPAHVQGCRRVRRDLERDLARHAIGGSARPRAPHQCRAGSGARHRGAGRPTLARVAVRRRCRERIVRDRIAATVLDWRGGLARDAGIDPRTDTPFLAPAARTAAIEPRRPPSCGRSTSAVWSDRPRRRHALGHAQGHRADRTADGAVYRASGRETRVADPAGYLVRWRERGPLTPAVEVLREASLRRCAPQARACGTAGRRAGAGPLRLGLERAVDRSIVALGPLEPPASRWWRLFGFLQTLATVAIALSVAWVVIDPGRAVASNGRCPVLGEVATPFASLVGAARTGTCSRACWVPMPDGSAAAGRDGARSRGRRGPGRRSPSVASDRSTTEEPGGGCGPRPRRSSDLRPALSLAWAGPYSDPGGAHRSMPPTERRATRERRDVAARSHAFRRRSGWRRATTASPSISWTWAWRRDPPDGRLPSSAGCSGAVWTAPSSCAARKSPSPCSATSTGRRSAPQDPRVAPSQRCGAVVDHDVVRGRGRHGIRSPHLGFLNLPRTISRT